VCPGACHAAVRPWQRSRLWLAFPAPWLALLALPFGMSSPCLIWSGGCYFVTIRYFVILESRRALPFSFFLLFFLLFFLVFPSFFFSFSFFSLSLFLFFFFSPGFTPFSFFSSSFSPPALTAPWVALTFWLLWCLLTASPGWGGGAGCLLPAARCSRLAAPRARRRARRFSCPPFIPPQWACSDFPSEHQPGHAANNVAERSLPLSPSLLRNPAKSSSGSDGKFQAAGFPRPGGGCSPPLPAAGWAGGRASSASPRR